ncbi:uncharacterized protein I303_106160 [Kwoniella dejecticola CBS 10117]|uniref:Uncharacterized protein n=1 Tax=Kwoniella dejecticola CBS 10117 TaxID=1296121 RepID=A0A1A6A1G0_9TREE|nr:uncharacterized protein I303_06178 [Kwoniella dejecticola CBS 10117]OBR83893.1 hypothetical protein I303_06178 [Kwoniella dejecticola CBS 10117]
MPQRIVVPNQENFDLQVTSVHEFDYNGHPVQSRMQLPPLRKNTFMTLEHTDDSGMGRITIISRRRADREEPDTLMIASGRKTPVSGVYKSAHLHCHRWQDEPWDINNSWNIEFSDDLSGDTAQSQRQTPVPDDQVIVMTQGPASTQGDIYLKPDDQVHCLRPDETVDPQFRRIGHSNYMLFTDRVRHKEDEGILFDVTRVPRFDYQNHTFDNFSVRSLNEYGSQAPIHEHLEGSVSLQFGMSSQAGRTMVSTFGPDECEILELSDASGVPYTFAVTKRKAPGFYDIDISPSLGLDGSPAPWDSFTVQADSRVCETPWVQLQLTSS